MSEMSESPMFESDWLCKVRSVPRGRMPALQRGYSVVSAPIVCKCASFVELDAGTGWL